MNNTRTLLREEIALNDRKLLLNEHSMSLIENSDYVKHVLGIQTPLFEYYSFELRKQIIDEALSIQGVLQSANNYLVGQIEKGKEYVVKAIDTVKSTKDIVILFKNLILSPENMAKANRGLNKICTDLTNDAQSVITYITEKLPNIVNFTEGMVNMLNKLKRIVTDEINGNGWTGFLAKFGLACLMTYIKINVFDKILKLGIQFIKDGAVLFSGVQGLLQLFKNFKETIIQNGDIKQIINWITNIGKEATSLKLTLAFDIMVAVTTVCTALLAVINFKFDLRKQ
jgi:hypothetical protein